MKLIKEILDSNTKRFSQVRNASRAVLFDDKNLIPLLFVSKKNYHKLPGGGIEDKENKILALEREVKEETGSDIKIYDEIGKIIEFRSKYDLKQISYCYIGKITKKGKFSFTKEEIGDGFKLIWVTLENAISLLEKDKTEDYEGKLILERDLTFLKETKKILSQPKGFL